MSKSSSANNSKVIVAIVVTVILFVASIVVGILLWDQIGGVNGAYVGIGVALAGFIIAWFVNAALMNLARGKKITATQPYPWFLKGSERNIGKLFLGKWNTMTFVAVAVGAALFGVLMVFGSIPVFTNTMLTSAMVIPVIVGGLFGALPAFATMLIGNFVADLIGGWGFWFDWSVGNGVMGLFIGALPMYGAKIDEGHFHIKHAITYVVTVVVGAFVAYGVVTPIMTAIFYAADLEITFIQAVFAGVANVAVLVIIGLPLLFLFAARSRRRSNLQEED